MAQVENKKRKVDSIPMSVPTGEKVAMPDVHAVKDRRGIRINRAGVEKVKFPMTLRTQNGKKQHVTGIFKMYGSLLSHVKGANMSRFVEVLLEDFGTKPVSGDDFEKILRVLKKRLDSDDVYISAEFDYFVPKLTPATKRPHITSHRCKFIGQILKGKYHFTAEVDVIGAAYCPCSKEICLVDRERGLGKGAHGQRSLVRLQIRTNPSHPGMWLEDMIRIAESSCSVEVYPLLKRPDEKWVTERGYDNPKYVEDIARDVMIKVKEIPTAQWSRVSVTNFESIHPHNAECIVEMSKKGKRWAQTNRGGV